MKDKLKYAPGLGLPGSGAFSYRGLLNDKVLYWKGRCSVGSDQHCSGVLIDPGTQMELSDEEILRSN